MHYDSIIETIGRTPAVRINRLAPNHVELYAKVEAFNPMNSVKDRMAAGVIATAERDGALKPGQRDRSETGHPWPRGFRSV